MALKLKKENSRPGFYLSNFLVCKRFKIWGLRVIVVVFFYLKYSSRFFTTLFVLLIDVFCYIAASEVRFLALTFENKPSFSLELASPDRTVCCSFQILTETLCVKHESTRLFCIIFVRHTKSQCKTFVKCNTFGLLP